jgi:hypothetical protein
LRAFYFAVALVVSIGPAGANELALPGQDVGAAQAIQTPAQTPTNQAPSEEAEAPLFGADPQSDFAVADGDAAEISDSLKAKVRTIIAFMRDQARIGAGDGSELVGSRIRVRCASKQVVAKSKPSLSAMPALMLSERAASEPTTVRSTTVEACTLKLIQVHRSTTTETGADAGKRSFAIELPAGADATH